MMKQLNAYKNKHNYSFVHWVIDLIFDPPIIRFTCSLFIMGFENSFGFDQSDMAAQLYFGTHGKFKGKFRKKSQMDKLYKITEANKKKKTTKAS